MKAAIYCRVSTKEQKEHGSSLETQAEACQDFAKRNNCEVSKELLFDEDWTGATLDRPKLEAVRTLIRRNEIDAVIAYSTDRLARNPIHLAIIAEECEKHKIKLSFVTEPLDTSPEGQLMMYVKGYAAQIEREKIADRTLRGKRMRAKEGRIPAGSGIGLYGYSYIPGEKSGQGIRRINDEQAAIVKMIFRWLVEDRMTLYSICVKLTEMRIPSPKGTTRWGLSTVARLVRNPAYTGKTFAFKYLSVESKNPQNVNKRYLKVSRKVRSPEEWIEIPEATPPIISEETFRLAQEQLRRNFERAKRNQKNEYLLSGHIRCGLCGRRYNGHRNGVGRSAYLQYRCAGKHRTESIIPCPSQAVRANEVESLVWEEVKKVLTHPDLVLFELQRRQDEAGNREGTEKQLTLLTKRINNVDRAMQRLVTLYRYNEIDDEYILKETKKLKEEKQRLLQEKEQLHKRLEVRAVADFQIEAIKQYCDRVAQNIERFTFEEKRLALEALDIKVIVDSEGIKMQGVIPIDIVSTQSR